MEDSICRLDDVRVIMKVVALVGSFEGFDLQNFA
jgi:hypothetical protein